VSCCREKWQKDYILMSSINLRGPVDECIFCSCCAGMAAGLQRHIKRRSGNLSLRVRYRVHFRVILPAALMVSPTDDLAVFDDHGAHHRIGACIAPAFRGQFDRQLHVFFVVHENAITSMKQSKQRNSDGMYVLEMS